MRWSWKPRRPDRRWEWCRIYHHGAQVPTAITFRPYGPLYRFDHHTPPFTAPDICPDGRQILYVASNLRCALAEVFGDIKQPQICPNYRVAIIEPNLEIPLLNLKSAAVAMKVKALPAIATHTSRTLTQEWAKAIYEDQPVRRGRVEGVYYGAAHTNDAALALWREPSWLGVSRSNTGQAADGRLVDMQARVEQVFRRLHMPPPEWTSTCTC
ncbi:RES domain-containing protein [Nocardioides sp.]|uniref:RES domain-containing protein n=1 Tax=Nocardioides sp. TaxID=35761 RepID=UPI0039E46FBA